MWFVVRSEGAHICCDINELPRPVNRKVHFPPISAFQRNVLAGIHSGVETYHMVISTLGRHKLKIAALLSSKDAESWKLSQTNSVPASR